MREWRDSEEGERNGTLAEGHGRRFLERHAEALDIARERLREADAGEPVEQIFAGWAEERGKASFMEAARFEHAQMRMHGREMHEARLAEVSAGLERNPLSCPDAVKQAEESYVLAVGQGLMNRREAAESFGRTVDDLRERAFLKLYEQNPGLAVASMDALGLPEEKKRELGQRHEADKASGEALAAAARKNAAASLAAGIGQAERQALLNGNSAALQELAGAFAALNEKAAADELYSLSALYERHAAAIGESGQMPLPDLFIRIEEGDKRLEQETATFPSGTKTLLEEEQFLRGRIYQERKRALAADPAGAVDREVAAALGPNSGQNALLPGATENPPASLTREKIADTRLAAQTNNGVPEAGRRILSNAEAAAYREEWRAQDAKGRLETALSLTAYGRHMGAVARELGLRSSEQLVLLQVGGDPRAVQALAAVIEANSIKGSASGRPVEEGPVRDALELSQVVRAASAAEAALPGNANVRAALDNYGKTLARLVAMEDGDAPAAVNLLDGRLRALVNDGCALVFDPIVHVDATLLHESLRRIQNEAQAAQTGPGQEAAGPQGAGRFAGRAGSLWINAPDGDGFVLVEPGREGWLLRVRNEGLRAEALRKKGK